MKFGLGWLAGPRPAVQATYHNDLEPATIIFRNGFGIQKAGTFVADAVTVIPNTPPPPPPPPQPPNTITVVVPEQPVFQYGQPLHPVGFVKTYTLTVDLPSGGDTWIVRVIGICQYSRRPH